MLSNKSGDYDPNLYKPDNCQKWICELKDTVDFGWKNCWSFEFWLPLIWWRLEANAAFMQAGKCNPNEGNGRGEYKHHRKSISGPSISG